MSRRASRSSQTRRKRGGGKKTSKALIAGIVIGGLALVGLIVWMVWPKSEFHRSQLDRYVEANSQTNLLGGGASVYVDMSDGMNSAYATPESKNILKAIINKLAADNAIKFYGLADSKISDIDMSHTELYNYMMNPASYDKQKAPIEETLRRITTADQPALLITDYEEYKGSVIEKAAYAKKYFIDWLRKGFSVTFYKWDFTEGGKSKHMFLTVFDDNAGRLNSLVANAVEMTSPGLARYVLGGNRFAFPTFTDYISVTQGGNYHNSKGNDNVTAVMETGSAEAYTSYTKPLATATGKNGGYLPLDCSVGDFSEYYPLGITWSSAVENSRKMQEEGIAKDDLYEHFLSRLYVDFGAQNGYSIDAVEVRVFNMQEAMRYVAANDTLDLKAMDGISLKEVNGMLAAGMKEAGKNAPGLRELFVDFDEKFDGKFAGGTEQSDLLRANIVISKATPQIAEADAFFGWEGNPSLAESVKMTISDSSCSPVGSIIYTYYVKSITE